MYGIGTVARLAQVSVRTLRHYDEVGLLRPAQVDPVTGYRRYTPDQVARLHRILVMRDLGLPLSEISQLLDEDVTVEQLGAILRLRRAEARSRVAMQAAQLTRVETRLAQLEEEPMTSHEVIVKRLEPLRLVALSVDLVDENAIGPACADMWPQLHAALDRHGLTFGGLSFALYEDTANRQRPLRLTTALPVPDGVTIEENGLTTIELPLVERAATTVVLGPPDQFPDAFRAIHTWVERTGDRSTSFEREVYIDCDGPRDTWVTELQTILEPSQHTTRARAEDSSAR